MHNHPDEAPQVFPVDIVDWKDRKRIAYVSSDQYPLVWIMPIFEFPGILRGIASQANSLGILSVNEDKNKDAKFASLLARPDTKSVSVASAGVRIDWFFRWLAKVAYGFAVAALGLDRVKKSQLRDIILGRGADYGHLIGGDNALRLPSQEYSLKREDDLDFSIELTDRVYPGGAVWWVVQMRFLGRLGTPSYVVTICPK